MSHGHGPHADASDPFQKRVAIVMALYTVLVAFNSMLTNQARTKAILLSNEATNKWAYYQSKSTKQNIASATRDILAFLPEKAPAAEGAAATIPVALEKFSKEIERYQEEKKDIEKEAREVTERGEHQQHLEHYYEYATTVAELALILASVALLLTARWGFFASISIASCSLGLTIWTIAH